ncbi:ATP-binding protein [Pedobacter duraquae]|uniref:histidine kinase n=1 Tax=Pedobacter duraquae TaxID=425511 RepID=A0A4R6IKG6_9SPHI|nr:ATP-binding protein [Pedobacter duraquae]TDO22559.1 PAS domain S-box-containing protein [Pedobacter duraquae]
MSVFPKMSDQELLEVLMLSPKAIAVYTTNDVIIQMANDAMIAFWGKDRSVIGKPLEQAVPELKGQPFIGMLQEVLATGVTNSGLAIPAELFIDGRLQTFYYDYEYRAVKNEQGPYCILHTATDVTELVVNRQALELAKEREIQLEREQFLNEQLAASNEELNAINEELHEAQESLTNLNHELESRVDERTKKLAESESNIRYAEEMLRFSIEAAKAGTWYMDGITREFRTSRRLRELFGFDPDKEVSYDQVISRIPEDYRVKVQTKVDQILLEGDNYIVEHPILDYKDQKERWVSAIGKLYRDDDGKPQHFSGLMLDITQQKKDEIRKNDFIGMVSHELKTPLTSLSGYIQVLHRNAKKTEDKPTADILDKAHNQLKKMTSMINGFLTISRLESGKIQLQKQVFELDDLLRDVIDEISLSASTHKVTLFPCPELLVNADRDKVGSVISNLLSNAVKYAPKQEQITVRCKRIGNMAEISIQDEGLGIDIQDVPNLFQRFYRIENKDNPHISGFGIGLYLSAEIVQYHGGKIWVESEKGRGSTFYFTLPLHEEPSK